jgi:hypothetical protein
MYSRRTCMPVLSKFTLYGLRCDDIANCDIFCSSSSGDCLDDPVSPASDTLLRIVHLK